MRNIRIKLKVLPVKYGERLWEVQHWKSFDGGVTYVYASESHFFETLEEVDTYTNKFVEMMKEEH